MTTILKKIEIDGLTYDCEFEGIGYETPEPDIGFAGGFNEWGMLSAEFNDVPVTDIVFDLIAQHIVDHEPLGDEIIVALNIEAETENDDDEA